MARWSIAVFAFVAAGLCAASSMLAAGQRVQTEPNEPGMPTVARMYILNSGAGEAVPVTIHGGTDVVPVTVMGIPPVTLEATSVVTARAGRQGWEYRQLSIGSGQDSVAELNTVGLEGWEAISVTTSGATTRVLLKRPR
jgi:hypothetical protein